MTAATNQKISSFYEQTSEIEVGKNFHHDYLGDESLLDLWKQAGPLSHQLIEASKTDETNLYDETMSLLRACAIHTLHLLDLFLEAAKKGVR